MPLGEENGCGCRIDLTPLADVLERYDGEPDGLIPVLQEAQSAYGYLPEEVLEEVARARRVPLSSVYGLATFFAQLRLEPRGRREIKVCHGTACYVGGAERVTQAVAEELGVSEGGTTEDGEFTLESVACLGCCGLAPVMMIGDKAVGRLSAESAREAVRKAGRR